MAGRKKPKPKPKKRTNRAPKKQAKPVPIAAATAPEAETARQRSAPDWAPRCLQILAETSNITEACKVAGIGRTAFYDRRDNDTDFAQAVAEALDTACDSLELEARRRAKDGVSKPIFGSGGTGVGSVQVGEVQEYSDTLMIFLLKAHRPEKYRENIKHEHTGANGGPISLTIDQRRTQLLGLITALRERSGN